MFVQTKDEADIYAATAAIASMLPNYLHEDTEHLCIKTKIASFVGEDFLLALKGVHRIYYQSRDSDLEIFGLGAADIISCSEKDEQSKLILLTQKSKSLADSQFYFGGTRFDSSSSPSHEWQNFGCELFILPLLQVVKSGDNTFLLVNFRSDGHLPPGVWLDHAQSLLAIKGSTLASNSHGYNVSLSETLPHKKQYVDVVDQALKTISDNEEFNKVVIGRRNTMTFSQDVDPLELFFKLKKQAAKGFGFFFESPKGGAFFGVSPELLYRRTGTHIETESVAGTRPRAQDLVQDKKLSNELRESIKDKYEHALVSSHVERKLKELFSSDLLVSGLEVVSTSFVHHLMRKYSCEVAKSLGDDEIISALHPTPATCGVTTSLALSFIREHEDFDRGFYAGPLGLVGKEQAEFSVAIRSALYFTQKLFVFAAGGIVNGSNPNEEWEEINNKQKSILTIFDG